MSSSLAEDATVRTTAKLKAALACVFNYMVKSNLALFANQRCVKLPTQTYKVTMSAMPLSYSIVTLFTCENYVILAKVVV